MAPILTTIASLVPSKSMYQVTARVTRKWEVKQNPLDKPLSLDMVLLDNEGTHIHATIPKRLVSSYQDKIEEGKIYTLKHFEVAVNTRSYKPVKTNTNIIKCTTFTSIIEERQGISIPKHKFEFHPLQKLEERLNKYDYLIDVIGLLTTIEKKKEVTTKNGQTPLRHIQIQDESQHTVDVTLWGTAADFIDDEITNNGRQDQVIVITSTRAVTYEGSYQIQSTYGTKIYVNLDIPETRQIVESREEPVQVKLIESSTREVEETMTTNRKTITELLEMDIPDEKQMFTCNGTITEVRTDIDWRYLSCTTCTAGIDEDGKCRQCKQSIDYPRQRYRVITTLTNEASSATLVLFGKEAEKVIGKPIEKLQHLYEKEEGKGKVYDILHECIGKEYTLKVTVGTSKYGEGRQLKAQKIIDNSDEETQKVNNDPYISTPNMQHNTNHGGATIQPSQKMTISVETPEKKEKRKDREMESRVRPKRKMHGWEAEKANTKDKIAKKRRKHDQFR